MQKADARLLDRARYAVIRARRRGRDRGERRDILSLLIDARTEDGEALTDEELRDELLTPRPRRARDDGQPAGVDVGAAACAGPTRTTGSSRRSAVATTTPTSIEQTIHEGMRSRPVIPIVGRRVTVPWRLGEYGVQAGTPVAMSILLLHHREDVYPDPFAFRPERWVGRKPGTYEWIPFGGGIRRCLGAALAMAEQRVVLRDDGAARSTSRRRPGARGRAPPQRHDDPAPRRAGRRAVQDVGTSPSRVTETPPRDR